MTCSHAPLCSLLLLNRAAEKHCFDHCLILPFVPCRVAETTDTRVQDLELALAREQEVCACFMLFDIVCARNLCCLALPAFPASYVLLARCRADADFLTLFCSHTHCFLQTIIASQSLNESLKDEIVDIEAQW